MCHLTAEIDMEHKLYMSIWNGNQIIMIESPQRRLMLIYVRRRKKGLKHKLMQNVLGVKR